MCVCVCVCHLPCYVKMLECGYSRLQCCGVVVTVLPSQMCPGKRCSTRATLRTWPQPLYSPDSNSKACMSDVESSDVAHYTPSIPPRFVSTQSCTDSPGPLFVPHWEAVFHGCLLANSRAKRDHGPLTPSSHQDFRAGQGMWTKPRSGLRGHPSRAQKV